MIFLINFGCNFTHVNDAPANAADATAPCAAITQIYSRGFWKNCKRLSLASMLFCNSFKLSNKTKTKISKWANFEKEKVFNVEIFVECKNFSSTMQREKGGVFFSKLAYLNTFGFMLISKL